MAKSDTKATTFARETNEARNRHVLASLGDLTEFDNTGLVTVYQAANMAFSIWNVVDAYPRSAGDPSAICDYESARAYDMMNAIAYELARRDITAEHERTEAVAVLADWYDKCGDDPSIPVALLRIFSTDIFVRDLILAEKPGSPSIDPHLKAAEDAAGLWAERRLAVIKQQQLVAEYPGKGNGMKGDPETEAADAALDAVNLTITDADSRIASATVTGAPDALAAATLVGLCNFMERRHSVECDDMEIQMLKGVLRGLRPQLSGQLADDVDAVLCPTIATYGDLPFVAH